jgi:DNA-nicking Smr family endonuclease
VIFVISSTLMKAFTGPEMKKPGGSTEMTRRRSRFQDTIRVPIEDSIDLHTFSPKEIPSLLEEYLEECRKAGIYEVRIIHGKGMGFQRQRVHSVLAKSTLVESFSLAPSALGGWGSTIAVLRRK